MISFIPKATASGDPGRQKTGLPEIIPAVALERYAAVPIYL